MIQPRGESCEFFHYKLLVRYNGSNVKIFYIIFIHSFNMISISTDLLEYKASFIWNLVQFCNIMFALLEPSTKFVVPNMVLTLVFINVNSRKYLLSRRIVCVVAQSTRHTSFSFILRPNNTWISDITKKNKA